MLASSSPPNVSRPRHGPFSRPTTLTPFSVSTLATAAPEAPAPMMHASARAGFALCATVGLPIFALLAFGEPWQSAVTSSEHFHERQRPVEADHFPTHLVLVSAIDGVRVETLPRMHGQQRHEAQFGLGQRLLQRRTLACAAGALTFERGQRLVLLALRQRAKLGAKQLVGKGVKGGNSVDICLAQDIDAP